MSCQHIFIVTGWKTQGLNNSAFHFTCSKCLVDSNGVDLNGITSRTNKKNNSRSISDKDNLHMPGKAPKAD